MQYLGTLGGKFPRFTHLISPNVQKQDTAKEKFGKKSKFQQYIVWIFHIFNVGNGITVLGGHFFQNNKRRVWNKSVVAGKFPKN